MLTDGGKTNISCLRCNRNLCIIWVTQPKLEIESKVSGICPHCNLRTVESTIRGKFHLGHSDDVDLVTARHTFEDSPKDATIRQRVDIITKVKYE